MIRIIILRDLDSNEHAITAVKVHNSELNGQDDLQVTINQQKNNDLDLKTVSELWEIEYKDINYKIVHVKQQTRGNSFYLDVRAIPLFYWEFDKSIIHADNDGSHTANEAFRIVFENTGYNFVLVDFSPAVSWEGFGKGSTRLELFKRLLERYNYEFIINGKTVYMHHLIGNDTNFMYKYKLNASNVSLSTDASAYFTHVKGFGDFEEGEEDYLNNAKLIRPATSPLASVVGHWEGKPLVDGRVTQSDTMDEMLQTALDESLRVTVEGTLHDVRKIYDIAIPVKGDRVWLHDERINLEREIRLQSIKTTYDEQDNIIACDVTFGSESIGKRYKANINSLSKKFADLISGKLKLPIISLEQIGMDMIKNIHDASSEIVFGDFGMMAISKTNPNHVFGVNSEGWYISQDGGATPKTIATAEGIYADALFAGTLWLTNEMNIESADGYLNVTGSRFVMRSKDNANAYVEITPDGLYVSDGMISIMRYDGKPYIIDGVPQFEVPIVTETNMDDGVEFVQRNYETISNNLVQFEAGYTSHAGRWAIFEFQLGLKWDSANTSRYIEISVEPATVPPGVSINPVTVTQLVYRDETNQQATVSIPLPPPTYDALSFVLKYRILANDAENVGQIRSTRKRVSG